MNRDNERGRDCMMRCAARTRLIVGVLGSVLIVSPAEILVSPAFADELDKQVLLDNIDSACPALWEPIDAGFIGGAETVSDPWLGNSVDRQSFIDYLAVEMVAESLTTPELETMAADPMSVIAECSYQKLQFMRLMAMQAATVTTAGELGIGGGSGVLAVPDGSSQAQAAESCEAIEAAYPSSDSGDLSLKTYSLVSA